MIRPISLVKITTSNQLHRLKWHRGIVSPIARENSAHACDYCWNQHGGGNAALNDSQPDRTMRFDFRERMRSHVLIVVAVITLSLAFECGGEGSSEPPPPPPPDFTLNVSPVSASGVVGNTTSVVTISFTPKNGFNSPVTVTLSGLPASVTASSSSPFTIQPGGSHAVSFSIPTDAPTGVFPLNVSGTSGSTSHTTQVLLTSEPIVTARTYQSGSMLYLESDSGTDVARIGLNMLWGGSIVEVDLNGTNFVNEDGTGREVQAAQWDGAAQYDNCAGCTGVFGWNPVQAGDKWNNGSPVLAQTVAADSIYVKTQPIQWNPDDKGGGSNTPVLGDT